MVRAVGHARNVPEDDAKARGNGRLAVHRSNSETSFRQAYAQRACMFSEAIPDLIGDDEATSENV